ncbi:MAG TPA: RHS repeat-associated core domain-containing protein [Solirubrobacteraceae bacterium]|jgi:RHS repeat-associated protein|nr:RHS repeat-associated core domain-containing protein [Solirubrobacteraceae bacterium]
MPVEQINNTTSAVTYLHHDQQGSTRLLTGSTGTVTGKCTYSAYGTPTCEGTATTPLGYDAHYTSPDTGLIYLRARTYDPTTGQFLSVDPAVMRVEQLNNSSGAVTYLHHDQAGSTRLLTGSSGETEATFTYGPYGELTCSTGTATTPLGYDGQYTNSYTGLIYMRARTYAWLSDEK